MATQTNNNNAAPGVETGRYATPADADKPQVDERAESPETRPDLEAPGDTAAGAASNIDSPYAGAVSKFFKEQRAVESVTDAEDTAEFDRDALLASEQQSLEKLANPATAKEMKPRDVAIPLADLAGSMAIHNPELKGNQTGDPSIDLETQGEFAQTRRVFMESCRKMYPGVDAKSADFGGDLKRSAERLTKSADSEMMPDLSGDDLNRMLEEDPRGLSEKVDDMLHVAGERMQMEARIGFDTKQDKDMRETGGDLAPAVETFYKLQLMRDELRRRVYGRADATPKDEQEIDRIRREEFGLDTESKSAKKEKPGESGTAAGKETTPALASLETAAKKEPEPGTPEFDQGKSGKDISLALNALHGAWKDEGKFAARIQELAGRTNKLADIRLSKGAADRDRALRFSAHALFDQLLPAERRLLTDAAEKESRRRERDETSGARKKPVTAMKLFVRLMETAKTKG